MVGVRAPNSAELGCRDGGNSYNECPPALPITPLASSLPATEYHLGLLKAKLAKYRAQLLEPSKSAAGKGEGFDVMKSGDARVALIGFPSVGKVGKPPEPCRIYSNPAPLLHMYIERGLYMEGRRLLG